MAIDVITYLNCHDNKTIVILFMFVIFNIFKHRVKKELIVCLQGSREMQDKSLQQVK